LKGRGPRRPGQNTDPDFYSMPWAYASPPSPVRHAACRAETQYQPLLDLIQQQGGERRQEALAAQEEEPLGPAIEPFLSIPEAGHATVVRPHAIAPLVQPTLLIPALDPLPYWPLVANERPGLSEATTAAVDFLPEGTLTTTTNNYFDTLRYPQE
jgi:hypothetical protein